MGDALLADTDIEEAISVVYASAVASLAGYVVARRDFDRDSVDLTIEAGEAMRPKLDLQLKASTLIDDSGEMISYFCPKRNYDHLRLPTQVPRLLVVMRLPKEKIEWLSISDTEMTLRHCAYWVSLLDHPETENATGQTVYVPTINKFDVIGLQKLMAQSRTGKIR